MLADVMNCMQLNILVDKNFEKNFIKLLFQKSVQVEHAHYIQFDRFHRLKKLWQT